jgi:hypothetical protein
VEAEVSSEEDERIEKAGAESDPAARQEVSVDVTSSQITISSIVNSQPSDLNLLAKVYQRRESIRSRSKEANKV